MGNTLVAIGEALIDFIYIIPYAILGLFFALTVKETDNIFSSIIMHMIHNSLIIFMSLNFLKKFFANFKSNTKASLKKEMYSI